VQFDVVHQANGATQTVIMCTPPYGSRWRGRPSPRPSPREGRGEGEVGAGCAVVSPFTAAVFT